PDRLTHDLARAPFPTRRSSDLGEFQAAREIHEGLVCAGQIQEDDLRNDLATTRIVLGTALAKQNPLHEAVAEFQAARDIYEKLRSEDTRLNSSHQIISYAVFCL